MKQDRITQYQEKHQFHQQTFLDLQRKYKQLAISRFIVFVAGIVITYFVFKMVGISWGLASGTVLLSLFLYLIYRHNQLADQRDYQEKLSKINEAELASFKGEWNKFESGERFVDTTHAFTYDLDIFGQNSLFQFLNRCSTQIGQAMLAQWLANPERWRGEILERQSAITELTEELEWSQDFQSIGMGELGKEKDVKTLSDWMNMEPKLKHSLYPLLLWGSPALFALLGLLSLLGMLNYRFVILYFLVQLGIVGLHMAITNSYQAQLGKKSSMLRQFSALLQQIEQSTFNTEWLQQRRQQLSFKDRKASEAIAQLGNLSYYFDQRLNVFMGFIINGALLWDIQYVYRLEKWKKINKDEFTHWMQVIKEYDALNTLGRFAYNFPEYCQPELQEDKFCLRAKLMGHPLIDGAERIDNDFSMEDGNIFIVTGANMAGKSTFLRTISVNLILAMNGAPTCAEAFEFAPINILTSIRTADSLADNASYFYAELVRLQQIVDFLKTGKPAFIIVDEMLRGTNSKDKQTGSRKFIEQLLRLPASGLVATHDLSLGTLANEYPERVFNRRFEIEIKEEQLHFDYLLREGISQNLNATFLMKQMGIME